MSEKIATREAYGKALVELGNQNDKVVVLDADLAGATMTKYFKAAHPDRFYVRRRPCLRADPQLHRLPQV